VLLSKATEGDSEGRQVALGLLSVVFYKHPTQVAEGDHPPKGGSPPGLLGKATEGDSEGRQVALGLLGVVLCKHPTQVAEGDHPPKGGSQPGPFGKGNRGRFRREAGRAALRSFFLSARFPRA